MRVRLLAAVRALLAEASVGGLPDAARLSVVVLAAKSDHKSCRTAIRARELGRWIGMSESTVDHDVLPTFRTSGAIKYVVTTGESGQTTGLECVVMPLWRARRSGDVAHPLALSKRELVTLLRLIEALFAPGWGVEATPAGLLAGQRGKGSATDRLALLLLVLQAGADGRVRMAGGTVPKGRGRGAATVARLLGCSVAGGGKVLSRLRSYGVVDAVRAKTGSGLFGKGRLVVPAVAAAHGDAGPGSEALGALEASMPKDTGVVCGRCAGAVHQESDSTGEQAERGTSEDRGDGPPQAPGDGGEGPDVQRPDAASGDLEGGEENGPPGNTGEAAPGAAGEAEIAERPGATPLHTHHPSGVSLFGDGATNDCFSGAAAGGCGRRPERAGVREDAPVPEAQAVAAEQAVGGDGGPLRGEQHDHPLADPHQDSHSEAAGQVLAAWTAKSGGPPRVWAQVPKGLEVVLAPVEMVWGRLERLGARHLVTGAVRGELAQLRGVLGPATAEKHLTDRLRRRMTAQGQVPIADPVAWLIGRALPRRSSCYDVRCDDGRRMDTGVECDVCQLLHADKRALRHSVAAKLAASLAPNLPAQQRKELFEARLREETTREGWRRAARHEQAAQERAARETAAAERRAQQEAAEAERRLRPCAMCGRSEAAGLCGICANGQAVERVIAEAVETAMAARARPGDLARQREVAARVEAEIRAEVERAAADGRAQGAIEETASLMGKLTAESAAATSRRSALAQFAFGPDAEAEAQAARAAELRRGHLHPSVKDAQEAAEEAAWVARWRTAEHLLTSRIAAVRAQRPAPPEPDEPDPYMLAAARVRAQIRPPRAEVGA
ncbi:hypothetical protein NLX86_33250 [Streptomyces sp. A3M-1-3]|uniref:hypothetical protein n=1 Tax=Streptomyces sp. A3M-1-3 TaxID=2962044 RepID=UPI0020B78EBF|nr:hypothetical protein [Streptomyces sp. A3M-1-3]MCP3822773.1 hypothetical protein [Streptomyces sp. A3M-1-3]